MSGLVDKLPPKDPTVAIKLSGMICGLMRTQLIFVAAKLGLADCLAAGERSVDEVAAATGTLAPRLRRIMRALASIGVLVEARPDQYALTPLGHLLRTGVPGSLRELAIMVGAEWHVRSWASILTAVKTNQAAFQHVFGCDVFSYLKDNPEAATEFNDAMELTSQKLSEAICRAYSFPERGVLVDVGGGTGFLLASILKRNVGLHGLLFETTSVVGSARDFIASQELTGRCKVVAGDFLSGGIPKGGDTYVLKYIIHDWDDDDAVRILANCRDAMSPASKIVVVDAVMPEGAASFQKTWPDIEMMVLLPNGRERTELEFRKLFAEAGLRVTRVVPTMSEVSIVEGELEF